MSHFTEQEARELALDAVGKFSLLRSDGFYLDSRRLQHICNAAADAAIFLRTRKGEAMKRILTTLIVTAQVPLLFYVAGYNLNERGAAAVLCYITMLAVAALVYFDYAWGE